MYFSKKNFQQYVFIIKSLTVSCTTEQKFQRLSELDALGEIRNSNALLCAKIQCLWVSGIHVAST